MNLEKLKFLRERNNLNITQVASILKMDRSQYGHYENNHVTIPLKHLINLCNYFDVSIDYIFDLTNEVQYSKIYKEIDRKKAGMRLKNWRKEQNLTQTKLATILNTVHPVIVNYENGKHLIATPFLYTICKKYNISADYLLGRINSPKYLKKEQKNKQE